MRTQIDVNYVTGSDNPRQQLDLKLPDAGEGPFPLIIFIHGGGFTGGSKADINGTAFNNGTNKGYAVASLNYRLASQDARAFPESVEDVLAAIRHLRANAYEYRLDPDRFAVSGFSAGAYLAGMVCVLSTADHDFDNPALGNAGISSAVHAAVTMAALSDFTKLNDQQTQLGGRWDMPNHNVNGGNLWQYIGGDPLNSAFADDILKKSNPLNYANINTPPIIMYHGSNDTLVPYLQSKILVDKINGFGAGQAVFNQVAGGHSGSFPNTEDNIFKFFDEKLGVER